jgi:hypothetical protein
MGCIILLHLLLLLLFLLFALLILLRDNLSNGFLTLHFFFLGQQFLFLLQKYDDAVHRLHVFLSPGGWGALGDLKQLIHR